MGWFHHQLDRIIKNVISKRWWTHGPQPRYRNAADTTQAYDHLQSLISWQIQFHYLARPGKTLEVLGLEVFHKIKVKEMPMFLKSWVPFCAFFWV